MVMEVCKNISRCGCYLFGFLVLLFFSTCDNPDAPDCIKATGPWREEIRTTEAYNRIRTDHNLKIRFVNPNTLQGIGVQAGRNVIHQVKTEVTDNTLDLSFKATCNFVRNYRWAPEVYLPALNGLRFLRVESFGDINCDYPLVADTLRVDHYAASQTDLEVDTRWLIVDLNSAGRLTFRGKTRHFQLFSTYLTHLRAENLSSDSTYVYMLGEQDVTVPAQKLLYVEIAGDGNVYYHGQPELYVAWRRGKGRAIALD